jgi:hypothetical protein
LAACGQLVWKLPWTTAAFESLWNPAFGAWLAVSLLLAAAAYGYARRNGAFETWLAGGAAVLGYAVFTVAVSMEAHLAWALQNLRERWAFAGQAASQPALWSVYAVVTAAALWRLKRNHWLPLAWSALGVAGFFLLAGFLNYDGLGGGPALNVAFLPRLALPLAAYGLAAGAWRLNQRETSDGLTLAGHGTLALLLMAECVRWSLAWGPMRFAEGVAGGVALWALMGLGASLLAERLRRLAHRVAAGVLFACAGLGVLASAPFLTSGTHPQWLALNSVFLLRAAVCAAAFAGASAFTRGGGAAWAAWLRAGAHAVAAVTVAAEFVRWDDHTALWAGLDAWRMTAAVWGVHAFIACRLGLKRERTDETGVGVVLAGAALLMAAGFMPHLGAETGLGASLPGLNTALLPLALAIAAVFATAYLLRERQRDLPGKTLALAGNAVIVLLLASEMVRWSEAADYLSRRMALGSVSALWALQAFVVIWVGLARNNRPQRVLGFALFGLVLAKITFYDLATLEAVYRIVSFIASGLLAILAGYVYHRFASAFLETEQS